MQLLSVENAPFILSAEDAITVDSKIDLSECHIKKDRYTRFFWNEFVAREHGYVINPFIVEFVVGVEGDRKAHAVASNPLLPYDEDKILAFGSYSIASGKTEVRCMTAN
jgi:hypothetical protein